MDEETQKQLQRKYLQLQILRQQSNTLLEQKIELDSRVNEIMTTINAIKKLVDTNPGEEIWSSLGTGTFVRADIKDTEKVTINIGANVYAKKTREEAIEILEKRLEELREIDQQIMGELSRYGEQIQKLEPEIQKLSQESEE